MTDTHTHLYTEQFEGLGAEAVQRALDAGVGHMVFPAIDAAHLPEMLRIAGLYPAHISVGIAIHPCDLTEDWASQLSAMREAVEAARLANPSLRLSAIGETGLDLHWHDTPLSLQRDALQGHLSMALEEGLPAILHCRDALPEMLRELAAFRDSHSGRLPVLVFHSFTGSASDVCRIREVCDPWFGINGVVTFKNAGALAAAVPEIGIGRLLLETDSPYLAPVPWRGKRNESAYLGAVCSRVASLLGLSPDDTERQTDLNALTVFAH